MYIYGHSTNPVTKKYQFKRSLPMLSGLQKDVEGVFAKRFEENLLALDATSNSNLIDRRVSN